MTLIEKKIKYLLPSEVQNIISEFWCWKKYYTNHVINELNKLNELNFDLSINHFIVNVIKFEDIKDLYNNNIYLKKFYYFKKSCEYFLNNKDYIYDLNKKIEYVVNNETLFNYYKKKYEWMCIINTPYYNNTEILEEIKYYSYMILYHNELKAIKIYHSLMASFQYPNPVEVYYNSWACLY
tara:strand:- start:1265 stop:1807 length:543 start_codon:yes stop_codon:yes gene_type:complete